MISAVWSEFAATVRMMCGTWASCIGPNVPVTDTEAPDARLLSDWAAVPEVWSRQVSPVSGSLPELTMVTV